MGKAREYYYYDVKKWLAIIDELPDRPQTQRLKQAVAEAMQETAAMTNGELRLNAVDKILFKHSASYESYGRAIFYDYRTVQNWVTDFVNLVGTKAGY